MIFLRKVGQGGIRAKMIYEEGEGGELRKRKNERKKRQKLFDFYTTCTF